jgi:hypothetical protein
MKCLAKEKQDLVKETKDASTNEEQVGLSNEEQDALTNEEI